MNHSGNRTTERGAVLVEGALCLGVFLLLLVSAFDLLRFSYVYLNTQHAVQVTATWAALGKVDAGSTRLATIKNAMIQNAKKFGVNLDESMIRVCPAEYGSACAAEDAGDPRTDFQLTVLSPIRLTLLRKSVPITFQAHGRNERSN